MTEPGGIPGADGRAVGEVPAPGSTAEPSGPPPGEAGEPGGPAAGRTDPESAPRSANQYRTEPIPPTPGHDDAAPSDEAGTGSTSEESSASGGIREPVLDAADGRPAIAVPGKPDGEVDTRT